MSASTASRRLRIAIIAPVNTSQFNDLLMPVSYTHLTLPTICSV